MHQWRLSLFQSLLIQTRRYPNLKKTLLETTGIAAIKKMNIDYAPSVVSVARGFKNPNAYLSDKIKVMLDGVAVNSETYGSGAFYGAVNIITKSASRTNKCNEIFAGFGSYTDTRVNFGRAYETNEGFDDFSAEFNLQSENIIWNTRVKKSWQGNYCGLEERLEL